MHKTSGLRDPAAAFPLAITRDDAQERRAANRAVAVSAIGLATTGLVELLLAVLTGSIGLLGDAIHNLSDVCHVGYEVTRDVLHRLADGIDPGVITAAEAAAGSVPGVVHAHARARWTGRTLRVEIEGWVDPDLPAREADAVGQVAEELTRQLPEAAASPGPAAPPGLTPGLFPGVPVTGAAPAARGDRRRPGPGDRGARGPR